MINVLLSAKRGTLLAPRLSTLGRFMSGHLIIQQLCALWRQGATAAQLADSFKLSVEQVEFLLTCHSHEYRAANNLGDCVNDVPDVVFDMVKSRLYFLAATTTDENTLMRVSERLWDERKGRVDARARKQEAHQTNIIAIQNINLKIAEMQAAREKPIEMEAAVA